jgi:hypothetical protein
MDEIEIFLGEIEAYCRARAIAESTFGRIAVNDGKFVGRLRAGRGVTMKTIERVRKFMAEDKTTNTDAETPQVPAVIPPAPVTVATADDPEENQTFRFYDNRQKYLMFVNTCSEKWVIAERAGLELSQLHPKPPALRVFDAGVGDGTVISRVMANLHRRFPTVPLLVVGKEISLEDVRLSLEKMPARFFEHPASVVVVTNLYYAEAPWLMPRSVSAASALNWHEVALSGTTTHEFNEQINDLQPMLSDGWQVKASEKTGNPMYVRPSVVILYREDHKFMLDQVIPKRGQFEGQYDMVLASQPYRANMSAEFKVQKVLAPLAKALAPGGRMLGIHSHWDDPAREIVQKIWPKRELKTSTRHELMKGLKSELSRSDRDLRFNTYSDARALFRYDMHTLPSEIGSSGSSIGTSTLFAAWNAAIYVYQVEDDLLADALNDSRYLDATQEVLQKHGGLWFMNESYVVSRKRN